MKRKADEAFSLEDSALAMASLGKDAMHTNNAEPASTSSLLSSTTAVTDAHSSSSSVTAINTVPTNPSRRFPSDLKTIPCTWPDCDKTFNRPARLTAHLRSHTNDRPFCCPHAPCTKSYLEEKHLRQHIKGSHTHERRYACDVAGCSKAFLTATRLRRHAAVHRGHDRFRCCGHDPACTRTFRKHQTLQRHIRVDHLGQPAYACSHACTDGGGSSSVCGAVFDSAGALRRHVERAHGVPKFWCEECTTAEDGEADNNEDGDNNENDSDNDVEDARAGFATKALLDAHLRRAHAGCLFCDARCAGPAALRRHVDMHHAGKTVADRKTIGCPYTGCGKTFTRQPNLNVHIRSVHEGLRFVCGAAEDEDNIADAARAAWASAGGGCGRGFVSRMKREEHIRYVHLRQPRPVAATATTGTSTLPLPLPLPQSTLSAPAALVDALAGTHRTLACPHAAATGCTARFSRHHDVQLHVQRTHEVAAASPPSQLGDGGAAFWAEKMATDDDDLLATFLDIGADVDAENMGLDFGAGYAAVPVGDVSDGSRHVQTTDTALLDPGLFL